MRRGALALVLALLVSACGSQLDKAELQAANNAFILEGSRQGGTGPTDAGTGPTAQQTGSALGPIQTGDTGPTGAISSPGGPQVPTRATKSEIRLGNFGTYSGVIGAALASVTPALRAWQADVNARGGLNGHPVRVIITDDGGEPGRALTLARRMAEEDKVLAFFGLSGPATQGTAYPYLEEHQIPQIGGAQHDTTVLPMAFVPQTSATKGVPRVYLGTVLAQSRARKIAFFNARECGAACAAYADTVEQFAPKVGMEVVYRADVSIAAPDYTAEVINARNRGADVVMMQIDWPSMVRVIRSARRQGWSPVFSGSGAIYEPDFAAAPEAEGTLGFANVALYDISPAMKPYVDAVRRYVPGGKVGDFGAMIWAGGKLFEAIAQRLGDTPTRAQIFEGLYGLRGNTLGGIVPPISFPRGRHDDVNVCAAPIRVSRGDFVTPSGRPFVCIADDGRVREVRV